MRINEIFYGIQGEGVYQGLPMVFVRLAGCNLLPKCSFCDTSYAWSPQEGKEMSLEEVVQEVSKLSPYYKSWVCITGGEPLWQEEALETLVRKLKEGGYLLTIETNGSFPPPSWYTLVDSWNADMKCPSSGVCGVSKESWFKTRQQDQIKFVVGTEEDLEFTRQTLRKHLADSPQILVSPVIKYDLLKEGLVHNVEWQQRCIEFCKEMRIRFSLQWHKIVYGIKKGV